METVIERVDLIHMRRFKDFVGWCVGPKRGSSMHGHTCVCEYTYIYTIYNIYIYIYKYILNTYTSTMDSEGITVSIENAASPRNLPNRETQIFAYLAIQIQIENLVDPLNLYRGI